MRASACRPEPGSGLAVGHPTGLALDAGEDGTMMAGSRADFHALTSNSIGDRIPSAEWRRVWLYSSINAATAARASALVAKCSNRRSSNSTVECQDSITALSSADPGRPIDWV